MHTPGQVKLLLYDCSHKLRLQDRLCVANLTLPESFWLGRALLWVPVVVSCSHKQPPSALNDRGACWRCGATIYALTFWDQVTACVLT